MHQPSAHFGVSQINNVQQDGTNLSDIDSDWDEDDKYKVQLPKFSMVLCID